MLWQHVTPNGNPDYKDNSVKSWCQANLQWKEEKGLLNIFWDRCETGNKGCISPNLLPWIPSHGSPPSKYAHAHHCAESAFLYHKFDQPFQLDWSYSLLCWCWKNWSSLLCTWYMLHKAGWLIELMNIEMSLSVHSHALGKIKIKISRWPWSCTEFDETLYLAPLVSFYAIRLCWTRCPAGNPKLKSG